MYCRFCDDEVYTSRELCLCERHESLLLFYLISNLYTVSEDFYPRVVCNSRSITKRVNRIMSILNRTDDTDVHTRWKLFCNMDSRVFEVVVLLITSRIDLDKSLSNAEERTEEGGMSEFDFNVCAKRLMYISQMRSTYGKKSWGGALKNTNV